MAADPIREGSDPQVRVAAAFTHELFEEHARMVYGLCRALLRDPDDADDATQATFVAAYQSLLGGSEVREPAAWLAAIARNECTTRAQARMREPLPLIEADLGHTGGPESELERQALVAELQQAIATLPEKQREVVVLRDLYGLHYAEVGAALGISVAAVESLLFRARRSLRVSLKPLASGALTVPVAVREGVAQALPALSSIGAGGGATTGVVGLGLLAKVAGGPAVMKAAAGIAAAVAAGSIAVAGVEHRATHGPARAQHTAAAPAATASPALRQDDVTVTAAPAGPAHARSAGSVPGIRRSPVEPVAQVSGATSGAAGAGNVTPGSASDPTVSGSPSGKESGSGTSSGTGSGGSEEHAQQDDDAVAPPRSPNSGPRAGEHDSEESADGSGSSGESGPHDAAETDDSGPGDSGPSTGPGSGEADERSESSGSSRGESHHDGDGDGDHADDDDSHGGLDDDSVAPAL